MATKPQPAGKSDKPEKDDAGHARDHGHAREFVNEPSSLDETTHQELRLMHRESSENLLFAKDIQWRSVGSLLVVFAGIIAIAAFTPASKQLIDMLTILSIVLACGVVFVLMMYQFWQLNEMSRIDEIEKHFSSLFAKIARLKSRREGNIHRYTLLLFMIVLVILGTTVVNVALHQVVGRG